MSMIHNKKDKLRRKLGGSCNKCGGGSKNLQIHHIRPVAEDGCNSTHNLLLLCNGCHKEIHKNQTGKTKCPAYNDIEKCENLPKITCDFFGETCKRYLKRKEQLEIWDIKKNK